MSERMTNVLGYATLFAILAAIWVMFGEDPTRDQGGRDEPTFEGLKDRINETATLRVEKNSQAVTLKLSDGEWGVTERDGYPADEAKVQVFLKGAALSTRREPKTGNPKRFDRLGLADAGTTVTLKDDTEGVLQTFIMGKRSSNASGRSLTYIFQETDTRAWLVTHLAEASADPVWWLKTDLLSILESRVSSIQLGPVTLKRSLGETDFTLTGLKENEKAAASWQLSAPARVFSNLSITDVQQVSNPLSEPVRNVVLETHDGLTLVVSLFEMQGGLWGQFTATFDAEKLNAGDAGMLPEAPADGAAEAAAITAKTHGWIFRLSDSDAGALLKERADFISMDGS